MCMSSVLYMCRVCVCVMLCMCMEVRGHLIFESLIEPGIWRFLPADCVSLGKAGIAVFSKALLSCECWQLSLGFHACTGSAYQLSHFLKSPYN